MTDTTYETKASRRTDAIYEAEYAAADRDLRNGSMQVAFEIYNNDKINDQLNALARTGFTTARRR